jgi:hypothetical protein
VRAAPAGGFRPHPGHDLRFHGGRTLPHLQFFNLYIGRPSQWLVGEPERIDRAITAAMSDRHLNNVLSQYFPQGRISSRFLGSRFDPRRHPPSVNQHFARARLIDGLRSGVFDDFDHSQAIVNLLLPMGVVLRLDDDPGADRRHSHLPERREEDSSLTGLGGYHGSVHVPTGATQATTLYYSICAYSTRIGRRDHGIVCFPEAWKNIAAVLYHEMAETRTDPDIDDVIATDNGKLWGWVDRYGNECGDYPMDLAGKQLERVMVEVPLANGRGRVPVQLQYSNYVHGPEGPAPRPRPFAG